MSIGFIYDSADLLSREEAEAASSYLLDQRVDAVIVVSATFHLGQLSLIINNRLHKPLLLWGFNELPYDGGKIRLNAVCGVNLDASNLYKGGNDSFIIHVGDEVDEDWLKAIKMKAALENTSIGLVGYHAQGFYNVGVDELHIYQQLGILVNHYELTDLFGGEADEAEVDGEEKNLTQIFNVSKLTSDQVRKVARLTVLADHFMKNNHLDVIAIRCWPEFAKSYGVSPCAMMSVLQSRGMLLACEGDVEAALSMVAVRAAGEKTPFMADLSQVNYEQNLRFALARWRGSLQSLGWEMHPRLRDLFRRRARSDRGFRPQGRTDVDHENRYGPREDEDLLQRRPGRADEERARWDLCQSCL
jgi:L-fucose isomerase-like protein